MITHKMICKFPVGTIIVAVVAVVAGIAIGIAKFISWRKKQEKQKKAFKLINGKADQDRDRLVNLLEDIEDVDSEILIETSDGMIEEVELVEPEEYDEDYEDEIDDVDKCYKLIATKYF